MSDTQCNDIVRKRHKMLSIVILNVVILNVIMLSVIEQCRQLALIDLKA